MKALSPSPSCHALMHRRLRACSPRKQAGEVQVRAVNYVFQWSDRLSFHAPCPHQAVLLCIQGGR